MHSDGEMPQVALVVRSHVACWGIDFEATWAMCIFIAPSSLLFWHPRAH